MTKLPKELTPELIQLIMEFYSDVIEIGQDKNSLDLHELDRATGASTGGANINLDTLTRLMKEWICKDFGDCIGNIDSYTHMEGCLLKVELIYDNNKESKMFKLNTEFEAVLKATHWVAKEKGLL